jgi:hypothetical protein
MPRPSAEGDGTWLGVALLLALLLIALPWGLAVARHQRATRLALPLCTFVAVHVGWYVLFSKAEIRYLLPALSALFVAVGLTATAVWEERPSRGLRRAAGVFVALLFAIASIGGVLAWRAGYGTTFTHRYHPLLLAAARHLEAHTPPDTLVGAWNAGILGYFSGRAVVNLDGVVNDDALLALREERLLAYVRSREIDVIVDMPHQFERFLPRFGGSPDWQGALVQLPAVFVDAEGRSVVMQRVVPRRDSGG